MKKLLLVSTVMAAVSITANATSTGFNGFYVGAGAGGVRSKTKTEVNETTNDLMNTAGFLKSIGMHFNTNNTSNGLLLGLYAGYGKNLNNFYVGGELSILGDFANRHINLLNNADPIHSEQHYEAKIKNKRGIAFGVAPRFGYVFGNNLIYIKPGFEVSRDQATVTYNGTNSVRPDRNVSVSESVRKTNIVFTPAFGYEKALGRILVRGEYSYNPGKKIFIPTDDGHISGYANASYSDHRLMIGVAYKF
ncbi:MAG: hypothetical protein V4544_06200 [Pseudomonadota bacterium]